MKIAFTGAGYIINIHAQAAKALEDIELVAIVDRFPNKAMDLVRKYGIGQWFETVEQMLASVKVDALVVGTPNYLHLPQTKAALEAGVHVMVEKPMAMNAREAFEMNEASLKSGTLLMIAHNWRFDPEVIWLKQQAQQSQLGKIIRTKSYGVHTLWGPSGWFTEERYAGGGAMADMGVHAIDTTRFLLGDPKPESVYAKIGTYYNNYDVDDTGVVIVNWEGGITSYIESGWWQPHADGPQAATQLYGDKAFGQLFPTYISGMNIKIDPGFPHPRLEHCPQSIYDHQMAYFIQCIREHRQPTPGGEDGLINMKIVDAAYQSAKNGNVVRVD